MVLADVGSCLDVKQVQDSLSSRYNNITAEGEQLFIDGADIGIQGLRVVVSEHKEREQVGEIDFLYEATLLAANSEEETAKFAQVFSLDAQKFVAINSPNFGYSGTLTLFRRDLLHRFEVITPLEAGNTMGRFFSKTGPCSRSGHRTTLEIIGFWHNTLMPQETSQPNPLPILPGSFVYQRHKPEETDLFVSRNYACHRTGPPSDH